MSAKLAALAPLCPWPSPCNAETPWAPPPWGSAYIDDAWCGIAIIGVPPPHLRLMEPPLRPIALPGVPSGAPKDERTPAGVPTIPGIGIVEPSRICWRWGGKEVGEYGRGDVDAAPLCLGVARAA